MFEENGLSLLRAGGSLVLVVCLMYLCGIFFRRISGEKLQNALAKKEKRLHIKEIKALDHRTRLAIVKCDETEHLILLSQNGNMVVDANIKPATSAQTSESGTTNIASIEPEHKISNT